MDQIVAQPPSQLDLSGGLPQVRVPAPPTQAGPHGIRFDFNEGCRVAVPLGHDFRIQVRDLDTSSLLFDQPVGGGGQMVSSKRYYVRFGIEVWREGVSIFRHEYDAAGRKVLARMEVGGLGDQIAWIGQAVAFARKHGCQLSCVVRPHVVALFRDAYPDVRFLTAEQTDPDEYYATYKLFIFYNDDRNDWQPCDYRQVGLCHTAAYMLGLPPREERPLITVDPGGPPIAEPYVCIATQATSQNKYWNNPRGWTEIVTFLKAYGYRVICIDQKPIESRGIVSNQIPYGSEDETGLRPLTERARWLKHAAFFVGLSSGLSWLAWAAGCPVVMISGFTHPLNEFHTPYRVINYHACNSCSNDVRLQLDPGDFLWCPRLKNTDRMFECTKLISADQVKDVIRGIPGFGYLDTTSQVPAGTAQKTLIFCTAFSSDTGEDRTQWQGRYRRWLDATLGYDLKCDGVLIVDDGSATLPDWPDTQLIEEGGSLVTDAPVTLYHFRQNLGRHGLLDFPGWFRSFTFAAAFAQANGYEKVIHIESDAFLLSDRITGYIKDYDNGWLGFWCPCWHFAETGIQVIAGNAMAKFNRFAQLNYNMFASRVLEGIVPFTTVSRAFKGDRHSDYTNEIPPEADYSMQVNPDMPLPDRSAVLLSTETRPGHRE